MRTEGIELRLERTGHFLGYRGRLLPLPTGWQAWNAYRSGLLVGSLVLACGRAGGFDWAEADYEGPFFTAGAAPAALEPHTNVARLECVYIAPEQRGGELWRCYAGILAALRLPVYASFANGRLRERLAAAHQPRDR